MGKIHYKSYSQGEISLFPPTFDEMVPADSPVRVVSKMVEKLNLQRFDKLYKQRGRSAYHPKMMLKVVFYAYMNGVYGCRKIEELLRRDVYFMWLSGRQTPDYITINRFRNRMGEEIKELFRDMVTSLVRQKVLSIEVSYVDGTTIGLKAGRYTCVWKKNVERSIEKLRAKIKALEEQIAEEVACDASEVEKGEVKDNEGMTAEEMEAAVEDFEAELSRREDSKEEERARRRRERELKRKERQVEELGSKLAEQERRLAKMGERNSCSRTDEDATAMRTKEDTQGQPKPAYNVQAATLGQVITAFGIYPNPTDSRTLPTFIEEIKENMGG